MSIKFIYKQQLLILVLKYEIILQASLSKRARGETLTIHLEPTCYKFHPKEYSTTDRYRGGREFTHYTLRFLFTCKQSISIPNKDVHEDQQTQSWSQNIHTGHDSKKREQSLIKKQKQRRHSKKGRTLSVFCSHKSLLINKINQTNIIQFLLNSKRGSKAKRDINLVSLTNIDNFYKLKLLLSQVITIVI